MLNNSLLFFIKSKINIYKIIFFVFSINKYYLFTFALIKLYSFFKYVEYYILYCII